MRNTRTGVIRPAWPRLTVSISITIMLSLYLFCMPARGGDIGITATLDRSNIALTGQAVLTINITGVKSAQPYIERVQGLDFIPAGQSSQYRNINGKSSASISYKVIVRAEGPGTYTIAPVRATVNGETIKTQPLKLHVSGNTQTNRVLPQSPQNRVQPSMDQPDEVAFLRVIPSKRTIYVGEQVPVIIQAYFKEGIQASINSKPDLQNTAFAIDHMDGKPLQETKIFNQQRYAVLTWQSILSGIKEGEFPLNGDLSATIMVRTPRSRPRGSMFGRDPFDDDFFNRVFGNVREKEINLASPEQTLTVLPLPVTGKPANFTGAVGKFKISATASPTHLSVGDPITLKIKISGTGNFDRMKAPVPDQKKNWKTYSPQSEFIPGDESNGMGEKVFEQAIIPLNGRIETIPPMEFSYFDTVKETYITLKTEAIPITVKSPAPGQGQVESAGHAGRNLPEQKGNISDGKATEESYSGIAPLRLEYGSSCRALTPLLKKPWFIGVNAIALLFLACGFFLTWRSRAISGDPCFHQKKRILQQVNTASEKMEQAICTSDSSEFFNAARRAIQDHLSDNLEIEAGAITPGDIRSKLPDSDPVIVKTFEMADAVRYSGLSLSQEQMRNHKESLVKALS